MPERYEEPPPPPPDNYGPPPQRQRAPRMRSPLGSNEIPKWISILVIVGVIMMFVGMVLLNASNPTEPPPDMPPEASYDHEDYDPSHDDAQDYYEDYGDWELKHENAENHRAQTFQTGAVIHNIGVLLAALPLLIGGLFLNNLDMGMRKVLIIMGVVLLIVMFLVPFSWTWTS